MLLGTGLVVELEEFNWLVKNADLASPYPALRFLDQLASRARSSGTSGRPTTPVAPAIVPLKVLAARFTFTDA